MGNTGDKLDAIERVRKVGLAEKRKLAAKGRAAIAFIRSKKDEIARAFYDIGKELVTLSDEGVVSALGHPSFASLCDVELGMSPSQAARLMKVARSFSQREAGSLTAAKATALVDLAHAIGGKTTPKGLLERKTVTVPGVGSIDLASSGAAEIARAAKRARAKTGNTPTRGVRLSTEDKSFLRHARAAVNRDANGTTVQAIAASSATGGRFVVKGLIRDARAIGHALIRAADES